MATGELLRITHTVDGEMKDSDRPSFVTVRDPLIQLLSFTNPQPSSQGASFRDPFIEWFSP